MEWRVESAMPGIAWPAIPSYGRSATLALLQQLEHSQWLAEQQLKADQLRQLAPLLRHAWETVPYYRESWAGRYDATLPPDFDRSFFEDAIIMTDAVLWLAQQELAYTGKILTLGELRTRGVVRAPTRADARP